MEGKVIYYCNQCNHLCINIIAAHCLKKKKTIIQFGTQYPYSKWSNNIIIPIWCLSGDKK